MNITLLQHTDIDAIHRVECAAQRFPWTLGMFKDSVHAGSIAWGLWIDETLAGFLLWAVQYDEAHVLNMAILPEYQHQGYGRQLLEKLLMAAKEQGLRALLLEVRVSNRVAQHLYERIGFKVIGLRKNYYITEDATVMEFVYAR